MAGPASRMTAIHSVRGVVGLTGDTTRAIAHPSARKKILSQGEGAEIAAKMIGPGLATALQKTTTTVGATNATATTDSRVTVKITGVLGTKKVTAI